MLCIKEVSTLSKLHCPEIKIKKKMTCMQHWITYVKLVSGLIVMANSRWRWIHDMFFPRLYILLLWWEFLTTGSHGWSNKNTFPSNTIVGSS